MKISRLMLSDIVYVAYTSVATAGDVSWDKQDDPPILSSLLRCLCCFCAVLRRNRLKRAQLFQKQNEARAHIGTTLYSPQKHTPPSPWEAAQDRLSPNPQNCRIRVQVRDIRRQAVTLELYLQKKPQSARPKGHKVSSPKQEPLIKVPLSSTPVPDR